MFCQSSRGRRTVSKCSLLAHPVPLLPLRQPLPGTHTGGSPAWLARAPGISSPGPSLTPRHAGWPPCPWRSPSSISLGSSFHVTWVRGLRLMFGAWPTQPRGTPQFPSHLPWPLQMIDCPLNISYIAPNSLHRVQSTQPKPYLMVFTASPSQKLPPRAFLIPLHPHLLRQTLLS